MPQLRRASDGLVLELAHDVLLGRSPEAWIRLESAHASSRHAVLQWRQRNWVVRDLGSRNGTTVDGEPVPGASGLAVDAGATLELGSSEERWVLVDASAPVAAAARLDDPRMELAQDGYLSLPSSEEPHVSVYEHRSLGWIQESSEGAMARVEHGSVVTVEGASFRLYLPSEDPTAEASTTPRSLVTGVLHLSVSLDEEHVDADLVWADRAVKLAPSVHWYLVLLLARARQADDAADEYPERERGWVQRDELCRQLRITSFKLNSDIHRLRQLLSRAEIADSASIVERRPTTGQLRLGLPALERS